MSTQDRKISAAILLADDNLVLTHLLGNLLARTGYRVTAVRDGQKVLAAVPSVKPDLILLDVDMPGLNGFEVCRRLKRDIRTRDIPVIFVTARHDKKDVITGFRVGGQDYIIKPFIHEELLARIRTHLTLRRTLEQLKASEQRYRELAIRDDLTGLYNTRYLYQTLQGQLDMHRTRPLSVLFMDVDDFKLVVDTYGHLNGSRVLAELADLIRQVLPDGCYGVSYGGDEFVLVLGGHTRTQGRELAEKILELVNSTEFLTSQGLSISITVSCGLAAFPVDAQTLADLLACADHALFAAKKKAKNNICCYTAA